MFLKHTYIPEWHKSVLQQTIRQHAGVTETVLARLYRAALDMLEKGATDQAEVMASQIVGTATTVGAATDERSGVYVWLAKTPHGNLLTVGQKWLMESRDNAVSTTSTKLW